MNMTYSRNPGLKPQALNPRRRPQCQKPYQLLHSLAAGQAGVVGGAAGDEHDPAPPPDGGQVLCQAPQRDPALVVGVPLRVHCLHSQV